MSSAEADRRLAQYGPNALPETRTGWLRRLVGYFVGPIPWMIESAAVLAGIGQRWEDLAVIVALLAINAGVGFFEEQKADNAIEALKQRLAPSAHVLRDGLWRDIAARLLVPGDRVALKLGNIVPADVDLEGDGRLSIDQSALTGESLPVEKTGGDSAYSGSIVRRGEIEAVVTATGAQSYFGRTAKLVETAGSRSHFQQAVLKIGNFLILATVGLVGLILIVALYRGDPLIDALLFALILTVAAIPVALPAVLSVTMAVGASTLAKAKAIVSRLVSIEELASADILCCDKTGTLTKNELTVGDPVLLAAGDTSELLIAAALACEHDQPDPIDRAVLERLGRAGLDLDGFEVDAFEPFDPVRKRAEAAVRKGSIAFRVAKGAPQAIAELVAADDGLQAKVSAQADGLAAHGYRTLGVARSGPDGAWRYLGLLPLLDPPRDDTAAMLATARDMGLEVRMVTGDHSAIAREIAGTLGLGTNILAAREVFGADGAGEDGDKIEAAQGFAQVFPEHKFKIVRALQAHGHVVGMTGDGVNDAPALKQADVGIAVSGATDAARAAADLVLTAPGLATITRAVEEARRIFARMTSYATFRIAETIRVLLFVALSILVFNFYPVTPVMIVLLAILNDFPIMMIAYDNVTVAGKPVRWRMSRILTVATMLGVTGVAVTFLLFWYVDVHLGLPRATTQTVMFLKLLVAGHLTIYLTRNAGAIWARPWPSLRLIVAAEATQLLGTLAAVYGWFVTPIGWPLALLVWGVALAEFLLLSAVKIGTNRVLERGALLGHQRYVQRIERSLRGYPLSGGRPEPWERTMKENHHVFGRLIAQCRPHEPLRTAVCFPQSEVALTGAVEAALEALISPVLIGQAREIRRLATVLGLNIDAYEVVDVADETAAAKRAIELCRSGKCGALMKGSLHTDALMHEALNADTGLRTARRESHVFVLSVPTYPHILMVTDAAVTIYPTLEDKVDIVQNAIDLACAIGIERPKVAILSAIETVNSKIRSTIDAAALCKMADRGQITGGVLEGPLAFDNAVSLRAAKIKHINSPVAGAADILVVPDLESGNMLAKQLEYLAEAETAGIVVGARVPIILTSRADGPNARLASCALAVLMNRARHQAAPMRLAV